MCYDVVAIYLVIQMLLFGQQGVDMQEVREHSVEYIALAHAIEYHAAAYGLDPLMMVAIANHETQFGYRNSRCEDPSHVHEHDVNMHFADVQFYRCPYEYAESRNLPCGPYQQIPKWSYPVEANDNVECSDFYDPWKATYHLAEKLTNMQEQYGNLYREDVICHYCGGNTCPGPNDRSDACFGYGREHVEQLDEVRRLYNLVMTYLAIYPEEFQHTYIDMYSLFPNVCTC